MKSIYATLDAENLTDFFLRAVDNVKAKTYDRRYPQLKARTLIPTSFEANTGALTISYQYWDIFGVAKIVSNYARDIPRVDTQGQLKTAHVRSLADSYGYSIQDIRSAKMFGQDLDGRKAAAAKQQILTLEDDIALFGDANFGLLGLLNHPNVPDVALPADGTGSSALWANKTADQIIRDINLVLNSISDATNGVEAADTLVMPQSAYSLLGTKRVPDTGVSITKFLRDTYPDVNFVAWPKLKGKGVGGTDVMVAYSKNPEKLSLEIPQDFEQMPPEPKGLEFEVNCHSRCGGVIIYAPLSLAKADGF